MKTLVKSLVLAAVAASAGIVRGENVLFGNSSKDPTCAITNDVNYAKAISEIARTDTVHYWGEYNNTTVNVPEGVTFSPIFQSQFYVGNGKKVTVNLDGVWCMTNSTVSYSASYPYVFSVGGCLSLAMNSKLVQYGPYRLSNGTMSLTKSANGNWQTVDWNGDFNFLDPNGTELSDNTLYVNSGSLAAGGIVQNFTGHFRAPQFLLYRFGGTNELNFTSGSHYLTRFEMRNGNPNEGTDYDAYDRTRLNVTGAETVVKMYNFKTQSGGQDRYHGYAVRVADGGTLELTYKVEQRENHPFNFVFDGGNLVITNFTYDNAYWEYPRIAATNSTFTIKQKSGSASVMSFSGAGLMDLKDTDVTSYKTSFSPTTFRMEGGSLTASGETTFGRGTATLLNASVNCGSQQLTVGSSAKTTLVVDGTTSVATGVILTGNTYGNDGTVDVRNGTVTAATRICLGNSGGGTLKVSGGTVTTPYIYSTYNSNPGATTADVEVSGGELNVSTRMDFALQPGCTNVTATVKLLGGTLRTQQIMIESRKDCAAHLIGNGGTFVVTAAGTDFLSTLTSAQIGAEGLVLSSDCDITIPKGFTNYNSEKGILTLTGSGTKTLSATDTDVSTIIVAGGTVVFADGAKATSKLIVKNGATVKFAGDPSDVGLTGLEVGDATTAGVLAFSYGQTLAIAGDVTLNAVRIALVNDFALDTLSTLVTATGTVPDDSRAAWTNALFASGNKTARAYDFIVEEASPVALKLQVAEYSRLISVESGTETVVDDISVGTNGILAADVAADASLTLSGKVGPGGLVKKGTGAFYLTSDQNLFLHGIASYGGLFYVATVAALGYATDSTAGFTLKGGTLAYTGADETYAGPFRIEGGSCTAVVIRPSGALTLTDYGATSGDLIKMGAGQLTIVGAAGKTISLATDDGTCIDNWDPKPSAADFPADGTAPTGGYKGLNVGEGELVLSGDSTTTFSANGVMLGLQTTSGTGKAALTIDGCKATFGSSYFMMSGYQQNTSKGKDARFTIRNDAEVTISSFDAGRSHGAGVIYPTTTVSHATLTVNSWRGSNSESVRHCVVLQDEAKLCLAATGDYGPTYFDVEDSVVAKNANGDCFTQAFNGKTGTWRFGSGSRLALSKFTSGTQSFAFYLNFAGGEWVTGGGQPLQLYQAAKFNFSTLTEEGLTFPVASGKTLNVARAITGAGGVVKTGAGTLRFETQGTWDSTLATKTALADPISLAFTGPLDVREGAVSIDSTACRTGGAYETASGASIDFGGNALGAATLSGAGTFANATLAAGTLALTLSDEGTLDGHPTLTGITLGGSTYVDFGRTVAPVREATGLVVATFTDAAPDISNWRGRNLGRGMRATLRVDGKNVVADVRAVGFMMLVK